MAEKQTEKILIDQKGRKAGGTAENRCLRRSHFLQNQNDLGLTLNDPVF